MAKILNESINAGSDHRFIYSTRGYEWEKGATSGRRRTTRRGFDGVCLINIHSLSETNYFGVSEYIKCHKP